MLARYGDTAPLVIDPINFAEISVRYRTIQDIDEAVPPSSFSS
ncbi:MAG: hypothetical protein R3349_07590 [Geminicoccaceae bacterium]|nr:hypothetical protein [Geminicoccaceae bacterium]